MLFFLLLMLLFRRVCHQVSNQADKLVLLAIFNISRRPPFLPVNLPTHITTQVSHYFYPILSRYITVFVHFYVGFTLFIVL